MGKLYRISGSAKPAKKGKAITFGYEPFSTESVDEFKEYINTHATIPVNVKGGHRSSENITEIYDWIRLDVDKEDMYKNVEKQLNKAGVSYIKKPSTSNVNKGMDWKWHYFIETEGISQNYDIYKQQYYKFLTEVGIDTSWIDMSLLSVVQNMSICGEDGIKKTEVVKGKVWVAPQGLTVLKPPKHNKKSSDTPKFEIKKALSKIDPTPYENWLKVGMALYDWCPKRGFKLYNKWSQGYKKYKEKDVIDKWNDFARNLKGGVTVGTLMHLAYGEKDTFENETTNEVNEKVQKDPFSLFDDLIMIDADYEKINDQEFFIDKFVPKEGLFMFAGDSGSYKSWLSFALIKEILNNTSYVEAVFLDIDGGATYTKTRVQHLRKIYGNRFRYVSQYKSDAREIITTLKKLSELELHNKIIVMDSLSSFTEGRVNDGADKALTKVLTLCEELRNRGATVILIHHIKKNRNSEGRGVYAGSYMIKKTMDVLCLVEQNGKKEILITMEKGRGDYGEDRAYKVVDFETMEMTLISAEKIVNDMVKKQEIEKLDKKAQIQKVKDAKIIRELRRIIKWLSYDENEYLKPYQSRIEAEAKKIGLGGQRLIARILRDYTNDEWTYKDVIPNKGRPTKRYKLIKKRNKH